MNAFDDPLAVLKSKTLEDRLNAIPELRPLMIHLAIIVDSHNPALTLTAIAFMLGAYLAACEGLSSPIEKLGVMMTKEKRLELFMVEVEAAYTGYLNAPTTSTYTPTTSETRH